jgi:rubredoxin
MTTELDHHGNCPKCGTAWDGGDIYEVLRAMKEYVGKSDEDLRKLVEESYAPPRRFSRLVGVEYPERYDGVWEWQCPDCKAKWSRFTR